MPATSNDKAHVNGEVESSISDQEKLINFTVPEAEPNSGEAPDPAVTRTIADHMLGDQPTATAGDDRLGFKPYVAAVAKFLTDSSTRIPLTLSIEGQWGTGKSSFMLQLQEALRLRGKTKIVSFNAWQYDADGGLWAAFIHDFDANLNRNLNWRDKVRARFKLLALRISWQDSIETAKALVWLMASLFALASIFWYLGHGGIGSLIQFLKDSGEANKSATKTIAVIGGAGGTVAALLLFLNQLKDLFKSPASLDKAVHLFAKPDYSGKLPLIHQVTRDFKSLVGAYAGNEDVYIFGDDLHKCEYSKTAELMQALLMLLSSAPKIALIIGLDREKVAAAMAAKQEKLLPYLYRVQPAQAYTLGMEYGQRFIEKFIQISYILPSPELTGLKAMINPEVPAPDRSASESQKSVRAIEIVTGKDDSETLNTMIEMANQVFDHNPRNVKQFVNMFRLQAFIANETGLFGNLRVIKAGGSPLTIQQLGKFVALCMRWADFVEIASADPNILESLESALQPPISPSSATSGSTSDEVAHWLADKKLKTLLNFKLPDKDFSLASVDFRSLTEISPARSRSDTGKRFRSSPTSDPSYYEPTPEPTNRPQTEQPFSVTDDVPLPADTLPDSHRAESYSPPQRSRKSGIPRVS